MPIGALGDAGRQVFALLRRLREELKVNTTCGLSNISFGLPHRHGINAAFIPMVIGAGMTSAIMNPVRPQEMEAVRGANVLNGTDENCTNWIRTYKDYKPAEGGRRSPHRAVNAPGEGAPWRRRRGGREAGWRGYGSVEPHRLDHAERSATAHAAHERHAAPPTMKSPRAASLCSQAVTSRRCPPILRVPAMALDDATM